MNSLSKKCQEAKEKYDQCFNNWFAERYLKGNNLKIEKKKPVEFTNQPLASFFNFQFSIFNS